MSFLPFAKPVLEDDLMALLWFSFLGVSVAVGTLGTGFLSGELTLTFGVEELVLTGFVAGLDWPLT